MSSVVPANRKEGITSSTRTSICRKARVNNITKYIWKTIIGILIDKGTHFEYMNIADLKYAKVTIQGILRITPVFESKRF